MRSWPAATNRSYQGRASTRVIRSDEHEPAVGWLLSFVLEVEGVVRSNRSRLFAGDADGNVDDETATWLVERAARGKREDFTYPPELPDGVADARRGRGEGS